jgi:hypothetical protein
MTGPFSCSASSSSSSSSSSSTTVCSGDAAAASQEQQLKAVGGLKEALKLPQMGYSHMVYVCTKPRC